MAMRRVQRLYTVEEYLAIERASEERHEYIDGCIFAMAGESFDRGEKFQRYQVWNPTLTDYVLVSQKSPSVEHYLRQSDGTWSYKIYQGLEQSFVIDSINCELRLADIYDRIVFKSDDAEPDIEQ